jgi:hypothetical protein
MVSGFVVVKVGTEIRVAVFCRTFTSIMFNPGPPLIPSSSVDPTLLSPPTSTSIPPSVFYSQQTPNRPVTPGLTSIRTSEDSKIEIVNQLLLPHITEFIEIVTIEQAHDAIKSMKVVLPLLLREMF